MKFKKYPVTQPVLEYTEYQRLAVLRDDKKRYWVAFDKLCGQLCIGLGIACVFWLLALACIMVCGFPWSLLFLAVLAAVAVVLMVIFFD